MIKNLGTCNKLLVKDLNKKRIYVSVGSACQTSAKKASHVLDTLHVEEKDKIKIIRVSLSDYTTKKDADYLIENLINAIRKTRK